MTKEQETLWQEMADLTNAKCQEACRQVGQCCSTEYCQIAAEAMTEAGHSFPKMPFGKTFVVDGKCIVPPHFRQLCVLQQCKINGCGFDPKDQEWTKKYFDLRTKLNEGVLNELAKCRNQDDGHYSRCH
jgi:hypothetical protein